MNGSLEFCVVFSFLKGYELLLSLLFDPKSDCRLFWLVYYPPRSDASSAYEERLMTYLRRSFSAEEVLLVVRLERSRLALLSMLLLNNNYYKLPSSAYIF